MAIKEAGNIKCYGPSATNVSVTKAGLAGTGQRDGGSRTMGRGLSESHGLSLVYAGSLVRGNANVPS